ncbi:hypothetical protein GGR90_002278 [Sphingopyxis italica]|uniref:Uncharacterized protein n=1 Tax=Sphingopyxis italica TaxID=1129133 RepID=A0A7X5XRR1_9SPHN|nr:hypothetical protein [Sphingopyxis italica]
MLLGRIDPLPAFAPDPQRLSLELRGDEPVEQADIGQPPAMIRFEQVAHHAAPRLDIGIEADEADALVGHADAVLGKLPAHPGR